MPLETNLRPALRQTNATSDWPLVSVFGWAAVMRPDRTVLHDGPVTETSRLVRESLALLGTPLNEVTHPTEAAVPSAERRVA